MEYLATNYKTFKSVLFQSSPKSLKVKFSAKPVKYFHR